MSGHIFIPRMVWNILKDNRRLAQAGKDEGWRVMGLFKSKYEKDLDGKIQSIEMNMSNNYKDAAQQSLAELERTLETYAETGKISDRAGAFYKDKVAYYRERLKGFTHKDQKPYWT